MSYEYNQVEGSLNLLVDFLSVEKEVIDWDDLTVIQAAWMLEEDLQELKGNEPPLIEKVEKGFITEVAEELWALLNSPIKVQLNFLKS